MKTDLSDLEKELKELRPRQVRDDVRRSIAERLDGKGEVLRPDFVWFRWMAAAAGIAAVLLALAKWWPSEPGAPQLVQVTTSSAAPAASPVTSVPVRPEPVMAGTAVVAERDEGVVCVPGVGPVRKYRRSVVDAVGYRNGGGMSLTARAPRQEIVLVSQDAD